MDTVNIHVRREDEIARVCSNAKERCLRQNMAKAAMEDLLSTVV